MKRTLIVAAIGTLLAGAAAAQSSVTIYGRLNMSVERQKQTTDESIWAVQNSASRIGFRGTEDLGGGLKAFFLIEHGFSPDTGAAAGTFWGRESNVGLEGSFGKVRIGNMGPTAAYFATADYISMHNHDTGTSEDAFYLYPGSVDNAIAYTSPTIGGFQGEVQLGLSEGTDEARTVVVAGNYDAGPLHLGAAYVNGADFVGPLLGVTSAKAKQFGLRGLYEFGAVTVGAYFINDKIDIEGGGDLKRNSFRVAAMYTMGLSEFHLNVGKAGNVKVNGSTVDDSDATQVTLAYNYNLSKRTKAYAFYTKLSGDGANFYADWGTFGAKSALALGVRHNF